MEQVRLGIVGIGGIGAKHAALVYSGAVKDMVLGAVCSTQEKRKVWAEENIPGVPFYFDYTEMLNSKKIDAVLIVTPHYMHPDMSIAAFQRGLHVLTEKPTGVYTKQIEQMNAAAQESGCVFSVMYNNRALGKYKKLKELLDEGMLGKISRRIWVDLDWYRTDAYYGSSPWRATYKGEGGGVLMNQASHTLDMWCWLFGLPSVVAAQCSFGRFHAIEVEDDVSALLQYADGSVGNYITGTGETPGTNRLEVYGQKGKLILENDKLTFYRLQMPEREFNRINTDIYAKPAYDVVEIPFAEEGDPYVAVLQNFTDCIIHNVQNIWDGTTGINGVMLANAMVQSTWENDRVALPLDAEHYYQLLQAHMQ